MDRQPAATVKQLEAWLAVTDILDTATDYAERKRRITLLERPDNLPTLKQLGDEIKAALRDPEQAHGTHLDKATGELVPALELPEQNAVLYLRATPERFGTCPNCGTEIRTARSSMALIVAALEDFREHAAEQRREQYE